MYVTVAQEQGADLAKLAQIGGLGQHAGKGAGPIGVVAKAKRVGGHQDHAQVRLAIAKLST